VNTPLDQEAIARGDALASTTSAYEAVRADVPVREQKTVAGHAVRAMYIYSGTADVAGINQDVGKVALQRGPIVYCLEETDNPMQRHRIPPPDSATFETKYEPDLLGGVVSIKADALCADDTGWNDALYRNDPPLTKPCTIKAIPYYAWDNRAPGWVSVWMRRAPKAMV